MTLTFNNTYFTITDELDDTNSVNLTPQEMRDVISQYNQIVKNRQETKRTGSGYLVTTKNGHRGRTYHKDKLVNGKIPVYLVNVDMSPKLDSKGQQMKVLCDPETLNMRGFID